MEREVRQGEHGAGAQGACRWHAAVGGENKKQQRASMQKQKRAERGKKDTHHGAPIFRKRVPGQPLKKRTPGAASVVAATCGSVDVRRQTVERRVAAAATGAVDGAAAADDGCWARRQMGREICKSEAGVASGPDGKHAGRGATRGQQERECKGWRRGRGGWRTKWNRE